MCFVSLELVDVVLLDDQCLVHRATNFEGNICEHRAKRGGLVRRENLNTECPGKRTQASAFARFCHVFVRWNVSTVHACLGGS
jgi:hypothetical protein